MPYDWLWVLLAAVTPVGELRLAIPLGIHGLGLHWIPVLALSLIGNMVPVFILVPGLERISNLLLRFPNPAGRLLDWRTRRLRLTQSERFRRYGPAVLVLFVAIPLPFTGAWTGSLAAWVFQVPPRSAIPLIALGVLIAGIVVTAVTIMGVSLNSILFQ
ncbi:MAG: small multi-drug export protein [Dehalococcoidia bacterium]|nr:small multi-drug export protein [Dehalococcoidia bacterium]MDP7469238.1 small multi-drug export protein [Dehalococcoidia bacterium]